MRRARTFAGLVAALAWIAASAPVEAVSIFSARALAGVTLSTDVPGGLDSLAYLGSSATYNASAQASFDVGVIVDIDDGSVVKSGGSASFGAIFAGGGSLGGLLLKPAGSSIAFGPVDAVSDEAEGHGAGAFDSTGASLTLSANVNGLAIDTGDAAFGNAKVRWSLSVAFQNLSSDDLIAIWTVNHVLAAEAQADPKGTAFATSTFSGTGADDVVNAAADPPIPRDAGPDIGPNPPSLSGTTRFNFALASGESKTFDFALEAQGNAQIIPAPASGILLATCGLLAAFGARLARRVRQCSAPAATNSPKSSLMSP